MGPFRDRVIRSSDARSLSRRTFDPSKCWVVLVGEAEAVGEGEMLLIRGCESADIAANRKHQPGNIGHRDDESYAD